jgi:hypothetical protein
MQLNEALMKRDIQVQNVIGTDSAEVATFVSIAEMKHLCNKLSKVAFLIFLNVFSAIYCIVILIRIQNGFLPLEFQQKGIPLCLTLTQQQRKANCVPSLEICVLIPFQHIPF